MFSRITSRGAVYIPRRDPFRHLPTRSRSSTLIDFVSPPSYLFRQQTTRFIALDMSTTVKVGDTIPEATFIHIAYQPEESLATCGIRAPSLLIANLVIVAHDFGVALHSIENQHL